MTPNIAMVAIGILLPGDSVSAQGALFDLRMQFASAMRG